MNDTTYTRNTAHEWEWREGAKHYAVRVMPATQALIWSGWMVVGDTPVFEPGAKQMIADFLAQGAPADYAPPPDLLAELRTSLTPLPARKKGWFGW